MNAPVALFVYNRPLHTVKTIDSLLKNNISSDTDLIIFSDAPKCEEDQKNVDKVRRLCKEIKGFGSVEIIERRENLGLAGNIISGINYVFEKNLKVIVLEDDIQTSPYFLSFMNNALDKYRMNPKVWHISGWTYPSG